MTRTLSACMLAVCAAALINLVDADCPTTGPNCVRSCVGLRNGNYQSCLGCDVFVICKKNWMKDNNPCPLYNDTDKTYWDNIKRECTAGKSKTCIVDDVKEPGGAIYIHWGSNSCPTNVTLIYKGFAAGSDHRIPGSGSDYICLTDTPTFLTGTEPRAYARVYGAEYQSQPNFDHDTACAVCQTRNKNTFMLPGSDECPAGFDTEYVGYVATSAPDHYRATHVCMDNAHEPAIPSSSSNHEGALFYRAEAKCGSLPCSVYPTDKNLLCAVCSD